MNSQHRSSSPVETPACVFTEDKTSFLQFIACLNQAGSVTARLLLLCREMPFMRKSVACTLSYCAAKPLPVLWGLAFLAEQLAVPSSCWSAMPWPS